MTNSQAKRNSIKEFFQVNWKSFRVLVSMLLANSLSMDWKKNKKKSIINIVTKVAAFVGTCALSYLFFYMCIRLNIFSLMPFVPEAVPSILINILLFFSFFATLSRVTNDLYFANDNRVLLTLPTNGNTLFLARLFVCFLNSYIKALVIEIPFLIGYFLASKYPIYMYFVVFFLFIIVELVFVLLSAIISISLYLVKRFLISHPLVRNILTLLVLALLITLVSILISIIPEKIDIFTNWGPYFNKIQDGMRWYINHLSFFYQTSMVYLGGYTGYTFQYLSGIGSNGLWTLLVFIACIPFSYVASLSLASPLYLRLASGNDELLPKQSKHESESHINKPFISQLKKEFLLYVKDSEIAPSYTTIFIALPLLLALVSKIFMAMDLNKRGLSLVQVATLLITMLIVLSANGSIARMYSQEGGAFKLARTYPVKDSILLASKLIIPGTLGSISIIVSFGIIASLKTNLIAEILLLGAGILLIYLGHLLYSASLDFTNPRNPFGEVSFLSSNENRSIILSFVLSFLLTILFYYFTQDPIVWIGNVQITSSFKVCLIGLLYFVVNIVTYNKKVRYVYAKGENL